MTEHDTNYIFFRYETQHSNLPLSHLSFPCSYLMVRLSSIRSPPSTPNLFLQLLHSPPRHLYLRNNPQQALNGSINPGFSILNTTFSLGLVSLDSPEPVWSFHHRGSANINRTQVIDNDTQYLVGSISKIITDLLVLRTGIDLDAPITRYLPSLANETSVIKWEEVTLAALADHSAGIPPDYGFLDIYYLQPLLEELEFPSIREEEYARCGVTGLNEACSQEGKLET